MKIALIEPFLSGSHRKWALSYQKYSKHEVQIFSHKGRHWKWRMYGGAVSLARAFLESDFIPDLLLVTDMLDLTTFLTLSRDKSNKIPVVIYFHENQITYPWSPDDPDIKHARNNQYGFINYTSALAADAVFFNSKFHQNSFLDGLRTFLKQFPDHREIANVEQIALKSKVLPLALDLRKFDAVKQKIERPKEVVLLWNHRWEYDKDPETFFQLLLELKEEKMPFRLIILGESYRNAPKIFSDAQNLLKEEIIHFGFVEHVEDYMKLLHLADVLPVTSRQDFFGGSVVEAIYCNCHPLLPRRLAYPEHIPSELHDSFLHDNEKTLKEQLIQAIDDLEKIRANKLYKDFVAHYDWSILAPKYDHYFEKIIIRCK